MLFRVLFGNEIGNENPHRFPGADFLYHSFSSAFASSHLWPASLLYGLFLMLVDPVPCPPRSSWQCCSRSRCMPLPFSRAHQLPWQFPLQLSLAPAHSRTPSMCARRTGPQELQTLFSHPQKYPELQQLYSWQYDLFVIFYPQRHDYWCVKQPALRSRHQYFVPFLIVRDEYSDHKQD